jgi:hypothetical protein
MNFAKLASSRAYEMKTLGLSLGMIFLPLRNTSAKLLEILVDLIEREET